MEPHMSTLVETSNRSATGTPRPAGLLLRAEGLLVGVAAIAVYTWLGASWWLFAALILAPDLSAFGYMRGPRTGAAWYNAAHTYVAPAVVGLAGTFGHLPLLLAVALIWTAHIGLDRAMGYGLKLPGGFKVTHLG
jgi:hypothetical protein